MTAAVGSAHNMVYPSRARSAKARRLCVARSRARSTSPCASGAADRKSTRLNSSHEWISYAVFCLKKKKQIMDNTNTMYTYRRQTDLHVPDVLLGVHIDHRRVADVGLPYGSPAATRVLLDADTYSS